MFTRPFKMRKHPTQGTAEATCGLVCMECRRPQDQGKMEKKMGLRARKAELQQLMEDEADDLALLENFQLATATREAMEENAKI